MLATADRTTIRRNFLSEAFEVRARQCPGMTPKTLLASIFPSLIPHQLKNASLAPHFPSRFHPPKFNVIFCRTSESQVNDSVSSPEPEAWGAAAASRGQLFLEYHQSKAASKAVINLSKKKIKKKEIENGSSKFLNSIASCYGCGAPLQTQEVDGPGYVDPDTYQLKKKHRQLRTIICGRCQLLSHGHMITAVGGNGGYSGGKQFVKAEQLREKLSHLRHEKALIVKLVDVIDFNGSFLSRVRDLTGANPIILVVTKIDLLPKGTDMNCLGDWVVETTTKKGLNVLSVHLTSSKSLAGIAGTIAEIQKEKKGRDIYILGSANVGKSAFINALLMMLAQKDPVAAAALRYKPIQSAVPGTTLGPIQINAFLGGEKLYDTPGVHLHHRQAGVLHSEDLPTLAPRSRLRGRSFPASFDVGTCGIDGFSIFWGGLVRVDVVKVLPSTRLTFYGPKALQIHMVPTEVADEFYKKELGVKLTPPSGNEKVGEWMGLETKRKLELRFDDAERPACDVAISGLGWFCVEPICRSRQASDLGFESKSNAEELHLNVHVPKPVEIFVRPPMPVGNGSSEWYQYRELTEAEEETRPKLYF